MINTSSMALYTNMGTKSGDSPPPSPGATIRALANQQEVQGTVRNVEAAETVMAMNKVLSKTPTPDDSMILQGAMRTMLENQCTGYSPEAENTLRIVSICSSSDTPYRYVIPRLLEYYSTIYYHQHEIQAQITHVIPPHKTISMVTQRFEQAEKEQADRDREEKQHNDNIFTFINKSTYSTEQMNNVLANKHYTPSPVPTEPCDRFRYYRNNIYNNFALVSKPQGHAKPSVPPGSAHYALTVHPIPTHVLPRFDVIARTRFSELGKGGLMLVCYPASRKLYDRHVLPCLDLSLHQMLALNMISTAACEEVSVAPSLDMIPSFDLQHEFLQSLQGAEVLHSELVEDFKCLDWGYRWLNEEIEWLRQSLARAGLSSSQVLLKLIEGMTKNREWKSTALCDVSVFVVRKQF